MSVCLSVTDVTSPNCNAYSGNAATRFTIMHTLGTSLLTVAMADMVESFSSRHSHSYRRATKTGQTTLYKTSKDCTIDEPDFIVSYQNNAEIHV